MNKKILAALLALTLVLMLVPAAALAYEETYVDCHHQACPGYCYCYDKPDSINGRNLGRFDNGTWVTVYDYVSNGQGGWCYVGGYNTKGAYIYGYVHAWALADYQPTPTAKPSTDRYVDCYNPACPGYCYCYDKPDSVNGHNLGRFNNGTWVTTYDYVSNNQGGWYYVGGYNTKGAYIYGYVHAWSLN